MNVKKVLVLKETAMDLEEGMLFYDRKEKGIGKQNILRDKKLFAYQAAVKWIERTKSLGGITIYYNLIRLPEAVIIPSIHSWGT